MATPEHNQTPAEANDVKEKELPCVPGGLEHHEVNCPVVGKVDVYIQGKRSSGNVVILTVHDLGCDYTQYMDFVAHPKMQRIRERTTWVHVTVPGQDTDSPDLPPSYLFPTMQKIGEDLVHILDDLKIKDVVCFGEGAGANILARFAIAHTNRVMGVCLMHCTGTTAGFLESLKDKVINWKLDNIGMNPTAEAYLVLHRYGSPKEKKTQESGSKGEGEASKAKFHKAEDKQQLKSAIDNYQSNLRTRSNPKNLKKFVEAFLKRTNIVTPENVKKLSLVPVLLITGAKSVFKNTTHQLHQAIVKHTNDKTKVEFIEVHDIANVLEEKPEKLVECFQYFLQGLGLVSSVPMQHVQKAARLRSMSMEEYDLPKLRTRSMSGGSGEQTCSPISGSPPTAPKEDSNKPSVTVAN